MQKITPFLWFERQAGEAARFYTSIFKNSRLGEVTDFSASFELEGLRFTALNGRAGQGFSEASSLYVDCASQDEVDYYWEKLGEGGQPGQCGWLKDKFGVSWQVIPSILPKLLSDPDRDKANRAVQAMMQMRKIDVEKLTKAAEG